jgi:hypothetical protein
MQQDISIMSEAYCKTLKKLHRTIQNKMHGMLSGVVFHHDNAHPHAAAHIRTLLEHFNWEWFDHPTCRPDLAPSNCHLFTYLKELVGITALRH